MSGKTSLPSKSGFAFLNVNNTLKEQSYEKNQIIVQPAGLFLGGILTDHVFEPFMAAESPLQGMLSVLFGSGKGSGIAIIFFLVGITGFVASLLCLKNPLYKTLDEN